MVSRVDPRKMMAFGFISISAAMYYMSTLVSLTMDFRAAFLMRTLQMFGLAFIFVPQNVLAYVGIPREKNNQISSMNSFMRNVGGSIGIALISTSIARVAQRRRFYMVAHATPGTPPYDGLISGLSQTFKGNGADSVDAAHKAQGLASYLIDRQAMTLGYVQVISILSIIILCLVPFLLIMRRNRPATGEQTVVH
jgi:DHA2 family multidrug resistance protein